jgi:uncharacterized protein
MKKPFVHFYYLSNWIIFRVCKKILAKFYQIFLSIIFISIIITAPSHADNPPARLAIIIDDIGYNFSNGRKAAELPIDITLAVLPFTPHGRTLAEMGHQQGKEIMLHTPMSNEQDLPLGPGALTNGISQTLMAEILDKNLLDIPHVKGVNNHMGSLLTQNEEVMGWLMNYLKTRQLYFVDSRTTAKTQALNQAQARHLPSQKRDVFLDDKRNIHHIRQQLELAIKTAQTQGGAIAIGHPYPETLQVLKELSMRNPHPVELVLVSELLSDQLLVSVRNQPLFCPIELPYSPSITSPFVIEQYLILPSASHKNVGFVIKKI